MCIRDRVAGEQENLLNSGVVSGGDAFREGVVGSGVGVPGGASAERTAAGMGFKHMVAASLVDESVSYTPLLPANAPLPE